MGEIRQMFSLSLPTTHSLSYSVSPSPTLLLPVSLHLSLTFCTERSVSKMSVFSVLLAWRVYLYCCSMTLCCLWLRCIKPAVYLCLRWSGLWVQHWVNPAPVWGKTGCCSLIGANAVETLCVVSLLSARLFKFKVLFVAYLMAT